MINQNELRFGNFISRLDLADQSKRVEKIIGLCEKAKTTGPIAVFCEYSELEPIELTESWLYKFGFVFYYSNPRLESFFYNIQSYYPFHLKIERGGEIIFGEVEIKYVHELQNIFKLIRGEELVFSSTEP